MGFYAQAGFDYSGSGIKILLAITNATISRHRSQSIRCASTSTRSSGVTFSSPVVNNLFPPIVINHPLSKPLSSLGRLDQGRCSGRQHSMTPATREPFLAVCEGALLRCAPTVEGHCTTSSSRGPINETAYFDQRSSADNLNCPDS